MVAVDGLLLFVVVAAAVFVAYHYGDRVGAKRTRVEMLRQAGFTEHSARLYSRAAHLFNRLAALTDLDGAWAGDMLSPETKRLVADWLAEYRKGITKA